MKRATITLPNDLAEALEAYQRDQEVPPPLTAMAQVALKEYLAARGYFASTRHLRITPASHGSGTSDVSREHDRYLAEARGTRSWPTPGPSTRRLRATMATLPMPRKRRHAWNL